ELPGAADLERRDLPSGREGEPGLERVEGDRAVVEAPAVRLRGRGIERHAGAARALGEDRVDADDGELSLGRMPAQPPHRGWAREREPDREAGRSRVDPLREVLPLGEATSGIEVEAGDPAQARVEPHLEIGEGRVESGDFPGPGETKAHRPRARAQVEGDPGEEGRKADRAVRADRAVGAQRRGLERMRSALAVVPGDLGEPDAGTAIFKRLPAESADALFGGEVEAEPESLAVGVDELRGRRRETLVPFAQERE